MCGRSEVALCFSNNNNVNIAPQPTRSELLFVMEVVITIATAVAFISQYPPGVHAYRWSVIDADVPSVCNKQMCSNRPHSVCLSTKVNRSRGTCRHFRRYRLMRLEEYEKRNIVNGHNGLRNRVARDHWYSASNMNLLHWDKDLARMAEGFLAQCWMFRVEDCKYLYEPSLSVGQNAAYLNEYPQKGWEIKIIRMWYLEGNAIDVSNVANRSVINSWKPIANLNNYTQFVWAETEFVGCAAARVNKGFGMICNYSPTGNVLNQAVYKNGDPCQDCSAERTSCSRTYRALCGLDVADKHQSQTALMYAVPVVGLVWIVGIIILLYKL